MVRLLLLTALISTCNPAFSMQSFAARIGQIITRKGAQALPKQQTSNFVFQELSQTSKIRQPNVKIQALNVESVHTSFTQKSISLPKTTVNTHLAQAKNLHAPATNNALLNRNILLARALQTTNQQKRPARLQGPSFYQSFIGSIMSYFGWEQSWDTLSLEKKNELAQPWLDKIDKGESICSHFGKSSMTDNAIVYATTKALERGKKVEELNPIYLYSSKTQREILFPFIVKAIEENIEIKNLNWIYIRSTEEQKNILLPSIGKALQRNIKIDGLAFIYENSTEEQKNILLPSIGKALERSIKIDRLDSIYKNSTEEQKNILFYHINTIHKMGGDAISLDRIFNEFSEEQKNILFPSIISAIQQGKIIDDYSQLSCIFELSSEEQQHLLLPQIINAMEKDEKTFKNLYVMYNNVNKKKQSIILSHISNAMDQGKNIWNLYSFYQTSDKEYKNILLKSIINSIEKTKEISHIEDIGIFYQDSFSEEQKNIVFPYIINTLKQKKNIKQLDHIYLKSSEVQKNLLLEHIIIALKNIEIIDIASIYRASNEAQKNILFPHIIRTINEKENIISLGAIFTSSSVEQKNILFQYIINAYKEGRDIGDILEIYQSSTQEQKKILNKLFNHVLQDNFFEESAASQSISHSNSNQFSIVSVFGDNLLKDNEIKKVFKQAFNKEIELNNNGYYVFYHAQMWHLYWLELLYTKLWQKKYQKNNEPYLFTRFSEDSTCQENAKNIFQAKQLRKKIMQHGRKTEEDREAILFTNYALFGNTTNSGSCSASYFMKNSNIRNPAINAALIFEQFKQDGFYQKHKEEIDALENEFNQLTKHGTLLQIAIPKKHMDKHTYITKSGGYKNTATITQNGKKQKITTPAELIEILKTNPEVINNSDKKEFGYVVTSDTIQKAINEGVEIRTFNTADPEKFQEILQKVDALLEKIVQEDSQLRQPKFIAQKTPWECYQEHKNNFKKTITKENL